MELAIHPASCRCKRLPIVPPRVVRERLNRMLADRLTIPPKVAQERADVKTRVSSTALGLWWRREKTKLVDRERIMSRSNLGVPTPTG